VIDVAQELQPYLLALVGVDDGASVAGALFEVQAAPPSADPQLRVSVAAGG
jgi:hypothetical protein